MSDAKKIRSKHRNIFQEFSTKSREKIAVIGVRLNYSTRPKEVQSARLTAFVKALRERDGIIEDFDESLWGCMVEYITVGMNKEMTVTFRDGTKI